MNLAICSLASGSSGNSYVIFSDEGALLIDAGISAKQIAIRLESLGLCPGDIAAVLVTHEHADHTKGLAVLAKKHGLPVYATEGTACGLECRDGLDLHIIRAGEDLLLAGMDVHCFALSHDAAEPSGYSVSCQGKTVSVVTDTGIITPQIREAMAAADILVLESNHDENVLRVGKYPWFLKQRILGEKGHLSNDTAAQTLASVLKEQRRCGERLTSQVLLAHLSSENNFPEMALTTMENILEQEGVIPGKNLRIEVLSRSEMSPVYRV